MEKFTTSLKRLQRRVKMPSKAFVEASEFVNANKNTRGVKPKTIGTLYGLFKVAKVRPPPHTYSTRLMNIH